MSEVAAIYLNGQPMSPDAVLSTIEAAYRGGPIETPPDRRERVRHPYRDQVWVIPCDRAGVPSPDPIAARGHDVSLWGMRFVCPTRLESGRFVIVGMAIRAVGKERVVRMLAQVRHARATKAGEWIVGCEFRETLSSSDE